MEEIAVISVGAEAVLIRGKWLGLDAIKKVRIPKNYRNRELDARLRKVRTALEARLMFEARKVGVASPALYDVDLDECYIIMEYIEGVKLRDMLARMGASEIKEIFRSLGKYAGKLHASGMVHGDLTTSNVIMSGDVPFLIDYGLGAFTYSREERAIDLHILLRSLESTHYSLSNLAFKEFLKGYSEILEEKEVNAILEKVKEIRSRGRYVKERK